MQRAIGSPLRTCVLTTPVHPQAPDVEAALRLLEAVGSVYDLGVDSGSLEAFAATVAEQSGELAGRLEAQQEAAVYDDRMST